GAKANDSTVPAGTGNADLKSAGAGTSSGVTFHSSALADANCTIGTQDVGEPIHGSCAGATAPPPADPPPFDRERSTTLTMTISMSNPAPAPPAISGQGGRLACSFCCFLPFFFVFGLGSGAAGAGPPFWTPYGEPSSPSAAGRGAPSGGRGSGAGISAA